MQITVKFASLFKALTGVDQEQVDVPEGTTVGELAQTLGRKYENIKIESELTFFVVNDKVSNRKHILADGDQVRIFQMVAGG